MIKELIKRYKQEIHPCMLWLLIHVYYDLNTKAWYNGDHILVEGDEFENSPVEESDGYSFEVAPKGYLNIQDYTFQELKDSFVYLSEQELNLLKTYMKR